MVALSESAALSITTPCRRDEAGVPRSGYFSMMDDGGRDVDASSHTCMLEQPPPLGSRGYAKVVGCAMTRPDQISLGKAIVGRPGRDDRWVNSNTAGWSFAAAGPDIPESGHQPLLRTNRLRKVHHHTRFHLMMTDTTS